GLGVKDIEEEALVELRELALVSRCEQLVAQVHEHAVVAGGVLSERGLELGGHQRAVAGGVEQVVEARAQRIAAGIIQMQPAADAAPEWEQVGMAEAFR